jgi:hypothetical protein
MNSGLVSYNWQEPGYKPLIFSHDWQVALLNWEPPMRFGKVSEIERHVNSDEVFILIRGRAMLFVKPEGESLQSHDMEPGRIYNVLAAVWHTLVASEDAVFVIVENRDTHINDTEIRKLTVEELSTLYQQIPAWVNVSHHDNQ